MVQKESSLDNLKVGVIGLGYVGLPLALAFGRTDYPTIGFDINQAKVKELARGFDRTGELGPEEFADSKLQYTANENDLKEANFLIVAVPTPVNQANQPDLYLVEKASELVGRVISKGATVAYESTVYPGVTEDICAPIIERVSGLKCGVDFKIGYSPERINPGDKEHTLERIVKVVAGMDPEHTKYVGQVYGLVCQAGVYEAANIKTAEAAKVIENTQRDINIALMNELSLIFHRIGIDTQDVLAAAGTKWNFLKFTPGLVGGHCIGVDPYYLVYKAEELGYHPQVIASGRRVNDSMPEFVGQEVIRSLIKAGKLVQKAKVLVLGLTFKENVKDIRNSKIADTIAYLQDMGVTVDAYDPLLEQKEVDHEFNLKLIPKLMGDYDAVIISSPHKAFIGLEEQILKLMPQNPVVFDIKKVLPQLQKPGVIYQSL